ncbi:MAG: OmpH family outer membrane protein [Saprospiraceae bacterium]|nr:OmpH family outer membrane protein [Candidatus Vicinibacter affinis]
MKIRHLLTLIVACYAFSASAQKIAHLNTKVLLDSLSESKKIAEQLATYEKSLSATGEQMVTKFQEGLKIYRDQMQGGNLTPVKQKEMESNLEVEQNAIGKYQQSAQESLTKRRDELLAPLLKRIKDAINEIAKTEGYVFIFDSVQGFLFADQSKDIFSLVYKKLEEPKIK